MTYLPHKSHTTSQNDNKMFRAIFRIIRDVFPTILREYLFRFNVLIYCVAVSWMRMGGKNSDLTLERERERERARERGGGRRCFSLFKSLSVDAHLHRLQLRLLYKETLHTTSINIIHLEKPHSVPRLLNNAARTLVKLQWTRMSIRAISGVESVKEL